MSVVDSRFVRCQGPQAGRAANDEWESDLHGRGPWRPHAVGRTAPSRESREPGGRVLTGRRFRSEPPKWPAPSATEVGVAHDRIACARAAKPWRPPHTSHDLGGGCAGLCRMAAQAQENKLSGHQGRARCPWRSVPRGHVRRYRHPVERHRSLVAPSRGAFAATARRWLRSLGGRSDDRLWHELRRQSEARLQSNRGPPRGGPRFRSACSPSRTSPRPSRDP
jgi:hypothetical protein